MSKLIEEIKSKLEWLKKERLKFATQEYAESVVDKLDFAIRQIESLTFIKDDLDTTVEEKINEIKTIALSDITNKKMQFIYAICEKLLNISS